MKEDESIISIKQECDNYTHTVWAILSFANHSTWDIEEKNIIPDSKYSLGRKMTIEKDRQNKDVTPDLVVQRNENYGIVCEAKKTLPLDKTFWKTDLDQLINYDYIKDGWFTKSGEILKYDIVFLTDISMSVLFSDYVKENHNFDNNFAIVGFEHTEETSDMFITLKKEYGKISDSGLDNSLRVVKKVPLSKIEGSIGKIKFYDSKPHVVFTTFTFWVEICPLKISEDNRDNKIKGNKLPFTVEEVTKQLQNYFGFPSPGSRDQEIPKQRWIREMFDFLVKIKLAKKMTTPGNYIVMWKKLKGDIFESFIKKWIKINYKEEDKDEEKQLKLQLD